MEMKGEKYAINANKGRKEDFFKEGDLVTQAPNLRSNSLQKGEDNTICEATLKELKKHSLGPKLLSDCFPCYFQFSRKSSLILLFTQAYFLTNFVASPRMELACVLYPFGLGFRFEGKSKPSSGKSWLRRVDIDSANPRRLTKPNLARNGVATNWNTESDFRLGVLPLRHGSCYEYATLVSSRVECIVCHETGDRGWLGPRLRRAICLPSKV
ncbi:hypothetical protein CR513_20259, partial [Mucuna pruriens]